MSDSWLMCSFRLKFLQYCQATLFMACLRQVHTNPAAPCTNNAVTSILRLQKPISVTFATNQSIGSVDERSQNYRRDMHVCVYVYMWVYEIIMASFDCNRSQQIIFQHAICLSDRPSAAVLCSCAKECRYFNCWFNNLSSVTPNSAPALTSAPTYLIISPLIYLQTHTYACSCLCVQKFNWNVWRWVHVPPPKAKTIRVMLPICFITFVELVVVGVVESWLMKSLINYQLQSPVNTAHRLCVAMRNAKWPQ